MPVSLVCNNSYTDGKGRQRTCGQVEPYIEPKTEKVFCPLCNNEMTVTHFTKVTLKNLKQFKAKSTETFSVKCQKCGKEAQPKLANNTIVCPDCNKEHSHLSEPFKIMLKEKLKTANKDVS